MFLPSLSLAIRYTLSPFVFLELTHLLEVSSSCYSCPNRRTYSCSFKILRVLDLQDVSLQVSVLSELLFLEPFQHSNPAFTFYKLPKLPLLFPGIFLATSFSNVLSQWLRVTTKRKSMITPTCPVLQPYCHVQPSSHNKRTPVDPTYCHSSKASWFENIHSFLCHHAHV